MMYRLRDAADRTTAGEPGHIDRRARGGRPARAFPYAADRSRSRRSIPGRARRSGARYPVSFQLDVPDEGISLVVRPLLVDQELRLAVLYWEGAVSLGRHRRRCADHRRGLPRADRLRRRPASALTPAGAQNGLKQSMDWAAYENWLTFSRSISAIFRRGRAADGRATARCDFFVVSERALTMLANAARCLSRIQTIARGRSCAGALTRNCLANRFWRAWAGARRCGSALRRQHGPEAGGGGTSAAAGQTDAAIGPAELRERDAGAAGQLHRPVTRCSRAPFSAAWI